MREKNLSLLLVESIAFGLALSNFCTLESLAADSAKPQSLGYLKQASEKGASRWPQERLPIKVNVQDGADVAGYRASYSQDLKSAFDQWQKMTDQKIRFEMVSAEKAAIKISWTDDIKEMMSSTEAGHTEVVPDDKGILQVTMKLLTKEMNGAQMSDAYATHMMLHEIGHALGILGHSPNSSDIMYSTINPGDVNDKLSDADVKTIIALYSSAGDSVVNKPLDLEQMSHAGDSNSPVMQAVRLNDEAATLLKNNQYAPALHKLEEAHALQPNNALITQNLGGLYQNIGNLAGMMGKMADAERYYQKAIPLLELSTNKDILKLVLKNYATILRANGQLDDAVKIEQKIKTTK